MNSGEVNYGREREGDDNNNNNNNNNNGYPPTMVIPTMVILQVGDGFKYSKCSKCWHFK